MNRSAIHRGLCALLFALVLLSCRAWAGSVLVPSDISVTLTAAPTTNLQPGQPIEFTASMTNHGPVPVHRLLITGPNVYDQFYFPSGDWNDCGLFITVVDQTATSYWYLNWVSTFPLGPDLDVGETRICHFQLALTPYTLPVTSISFGLPDFYVDPNSANDRVTIWLSRAVEPIPTLSPGILALLAGLLALAVACRLR